MANRRGRRHPAGPQELRSGHHHGARHGPAGLGADHHGRRPARPAGAAARRRLQLRPPHGALHPDVRRHGVELEHPRRLYGIHLARPPGVLLHRRLLLGIAARLFRHLDAGHRAARRPGRGCARLPDRPHHAQDAGTDLHHLLDRAPDGRAHPVRQLGLRRRLERRHAAEARSLRAMDQASVLLRVPGHRRRHGLRLLPHQALEVRPASAGDQPGRGESGKRRHRHPALQIRRVRHLGLLRRRLRRGLGRVPHLHPAQSLPHPAGRGEHGADVHPGRQRHRRGPDRRRDPHRRLQRGERRVLRGERDQHPRHRADHGADADVLPQRHRRHARAEEEAAAVPELGLSGPKVAWRLRARAAARPYQRGIVGR